MRKHHFYLFPALLSLLVLFSCQTRQTGLLPSVTGKPNEVLVVVDRADWDGRIGAEYKELLMQAQTGLPQDEPKFKITHVPTSAFDKVFYPHRNILITKISPSNKKARIIVQKDVWANPQLVLNLVAPDDSSFLRLLEEKGERVVNILEDTERKRLMDSYRKNQQKGLKLQIQDKHKVSLIVPNGYSVYKDTSDFIWLAQDRGDELLGFFIYHYPYTEKNTFTRDYLLEKRDEFLKKYVPAEVEGSYMTTERLILPEHTAVSMKEGKYAAELRGLWRVEEGLAMGGPFVSISTVDDKRNRVITLEGYIFAPGKSKMILLRQIEAVVYSLEIPE